MNQSSLQRWGQCVFIADAQGLSQCPKGRGWHGYKTTGVHYLLCICASISWPYDTCPLGYERVNDCVNVCRKAGLRITHDV